MGYFTSFQLVTEVILFHLHHAVNRNAYLKSGIHFKCQALSNSLRKL